MDRLVSARPAMAATSFQDPAVAAFRAEIRRWVTAAVPRFRMPKGIDEAAQMKIRRAWEGEIYRAGYNCLAWPTEFGGRNLGPIEELVFQEECIAADAPEPLGRVGRLLAAPGLFGHGTPEQRARFLPPILECREIWCQGFSEPNAGSDLASLRTAARRDGDRYLINGQKIWTSFGHYADWCLLLARTGDAASRHRGLTMFLVPMHQPGVRVRRIVQISGLAEFSEVFYDNAEVPLDCVLGAEGDGWRVAMTVLTAERGAGFAALALQNLTEILALLKDSAAGRADLAAKVAALDTRLSIVRWQIMRAIERMAAGRNATPSASILKLVWSELEQDMIRTGFETDCPRHRERWRFLELECRSSTIASGSSEIMRNVIAERVLGLPR